MQRSVLLGLTVLLASVAIAALHAMLLEAFKGNHVMMVLAAAFWVFIISTALISDRRRNH